jgi:O-antigen/teichoic acid export membrane protein
LARLLNPTGLGVYSYAYALGGLLALPSQSGLPILVMRETAKGLVNKEFGTVRGVWEWSSRFVLGVSLAILSVSIILFFFRNGNVSSTDDGILLWAFLLIPVVSFSTLIGAALKGLHYPIAGQLPEFLIRPLVLVIILSLLYSLNSAISPLAAMMTTVLASFLSLITALVMLAKKAPSEIRTVSPVYSSREWIASTFPLALIDSMRLVNLQVDLIMLGFLTSSEEVGIYRIAMQLSVLASFGLIAVNQAISPRFVKLYYKKDMKGLQEIVKKSTRMIFLSNLAISIIMIVFTPSVISIFFGSSFSNAYTPVLILLIGQFVNSASGSVGTLLQMTGNERISALVLSFTSFLNIFLNALLIPKYGITGAAISTCISLSISNIALSYFVWKKIRINTLILNFS